MRLLISLVEQGIGSALTFAVSLWLIHKAPGDSYGVYVFWYSVALRTCRAGASPSASCCQRRWCW
jgi:hypothetical protein